MKKAIIYGLFSILLPIAAAAAFYITFKSFGNTIESNMHYVMTPSQEQNDIIYVGNSRTVVHIDPRVVESVTGLRGYNLGLDGCTVVYFNMMLSKYLQCHPKPKYVILNADFFGFDTRAQVFNYPDYQPYLRDSTVRACLVPYCPEYQSGFLMKYSLLRQINSKSDDQKLADFIYYIQKFKNITHKSSGIDTLRGYQPSDNTWEGQSHNLKQYTAVYTPEGMDLMRRMIRSCQSQGVRVIMVCPPLYKDYHTIVTNYDAIKDSLQNIANTYHVPYWIYSDTYLSDTTANFYNVEHLTASAANTFSHMMAEDIRQYIADPTFAPDMAGRKAKPNL